MRMLDFTLASLVLPCWNLCLCSWHLAWCHIMVAVSSLHSKSFALPWQSWGWTRGCTSLLFKLGCLKVLFPVSCGSGSPHWTSVLVFLFTGLIVKSFRKLCRSASLSHSARKWQSWLTALWLLWDLYRPPVQPHGSSSDLVKLQAS